MGNFAICPILCTKLCLMYCQMGNFYYFSFCLTCWLLKPWHFGKFCHLPTKICHFLNMSKWSSNLIPPSNCLHPSIYNLGTLGVKINCIYAKCFVNKFINMGIVLATCIHGVVCGSVPSCLYFMSLH